MFWGWLPAYNLFIGLGAGAGFAFFFTECSRTKRLEDHEDKLVRVVLFTLLLAFLGALLFTRLVGGVSGPLFPLRGFTFYGGLLGGAAGLLISCSIWSVPKLPVMDLAAPCNALAHGIGRLGCFFGGCCYGMEAGPFWEGAGFERVPVQLLESAGCLAISAFLFRKRRRRKHAPGSVFTYYLGLYAGLRIVLEMYRDDVRGNSITFGDWALSPSQFIGVLCALTAVGMGLFLRSTRRTGRSTGSDPRSAD